jgi:hypothetical protein
VACKRSASDGAEPNRTNGTPSASGVAAPVASGVPIAPAQISRAVNPRGERPYSGKTGTLRGTITITGDEPPLREDTLAKIPADCKAAREVYARPFRTGMMGALADVLVTVTGYSGYVPAKADSRQVVARDCAWDSRTIAITYGQRLEVISKDGRGYVPKLVGANAPAQLIVIPGGDPVPLHPTQPGRYVLTDSGKDYMRADVLVLKYSTFDVTGPDGKYEIVDIPVGDVTVNAFLPATLSTKEHRIKIEPGGAHELDIELTFDKQRLEALQRPAEAGAAPP